ncbi:MAG: dephospho-CoA kinase [Candidatus Hydrogenedentes bacterium]|nr:dephospho-CoA kinase [Candidatus Hydrogenedentota bacterium]
MKIIGITGGIGSGKSVAADYFRKAGIPVIDTDKTGHDLLENNTTVQKAVIADFGDDITEDGKTISREKLAALIFTDTLSRQRLNAILHPEIIAEVKRYCTVLQEAGKRAVLVEAALIGESKHKEPWLTALILVAASESVRIKRLMQYRDFSREEAQRRIAVQTPPEKKIALADWIIDNNSHLEALQTQVLQIAEEILEKDK